MSNPSQLALDDELGRDNLIAVIVYNSWGHLVDVIPAFLGDRGGELRRDRWSLHAAMLWAHLAVHRAERLPPI